MRKERRGEGKENETDKTKRGVRRGKRKISGEGKETRQRKRGRRRRRRHKEREKGRDRSQRRLTRGRDEIKGSRGCMIREEIQQIYDNEV